MKKGLDILAGCRFRIELETPVYAVQIGEQPARKMKLPLMYSAFVTPD
jgi:hypothetical protein